MPLEPLKCRLASPEQVEQFNKLDAILADVESQLPRVAARNEFKGELNPITKHVEGVMPALKRLKNTLAREYYQVGLLGVTGASKSTSLNSLIGHEVLPKGSEGMPCTSVIQRIRFVPRNKKPAISMVFLSEEEWWTRRKLLLDDLKLQDFAATDDDEELLARIDEALEEKNLAGDKDTTPLLKFFGRFLRSGSTHRHRLKGGQHLGPIHLPDLPALHSALNSVASHKGGDVDVEIEGHILQGSECSLLREVYVEIPIDNPPSELELVDLPGFLAKSSQDDVITKSYLDLLDGACFLLNTQNLGLAVVDDYRRVLTQRFGALHGRVWLVATKIDSLAGDQLHSMNSSIFHGIDKAVRNWNFQSEDEVYKHLLITSNVIYDQTRDQDPANIPLIVATSLKMRLDKDGKFPVPQPLEKHEQLQGVRRAFMHVLEDGGLGRFRQVVQVELAKNVRVAVSKATRQSMLDLVDLAVRNIEACRDQRGLTSEDHTVAIAWSNKFRVLQRQTNLLEELVGISIGSVRTKLLSLLDQICPKDNLPTPEHLPSRHANFSSSVASDILKFWISNEAGAPGGVVGEAIARLQARARELAKLENLENRSRNLDAVLHPLDTLKAVALELASRDDSHAQPFKELACPVLFVGHWPTEITPKLYREMMIRKIDNIVYEACHRLQNVLRSALEEVELRLERLREDGASASTDSVSRETYEQFIANLQSFQASVMSSPENVSN